MGPYIIGVFLFRRFKMEGIERKNRIIAPVYKRIKLVDGLFLYKLVDFIDDAEYNKDNDEMIFYPKKNKKLNYMEDLVYTATDEKYCYGEFFYEDEISISFGEENLEEAISKYKQSLKEIIKFGFFDIEEEYLKIVNVDSYKMKGAPLDPDSWDFAMSYDSTIEDEVVTFPVNTIKSVVDAISKADYETAQEYLESVLDSVDEGKELLEEEEEEAESEVEVSTKSVKISEQKNSDELDNLIGLSNVKQEVRRLTNYLKYVEKTKDHLNMDDINIHMAFYGNPGTGKTTVARIIAKKLFDLGYAKSDKFTETTARDFIAGYIGQTAMKTRKILDENKGGVMFIDEAYIFSSNEKNNESYANEAIVEILKELEKKNTIFIFAGYKDEMKEFIEMNPGLKSRIGYHLEFLDYNLDELYQIFTYKINKFGLKIGEGLESRVKAIFATYKDKPRFSNGRFVDNLIQRIVVNHADRTTDVTDIEILTTLECEDIVDNDLKEIASKGTQKVIKGFGGE